MNENVKEVDDIIDFFPTDWYTEPESSYFLLRIYTIVPVPLSKLPELFKKRRGKIYDDGVPIWVSGCSLKKDGLVSLESIFAYSHPESGNIVAPSKIDTKNLPLSSYLVMGTPLRIDGQDLGEDNVIRRLNRFESLLSACLGSNSVYKMVFEAFYPAKKGGDYSVVGDVMAIIQSCDGPHMDEANWQCCDEIFGSIEKLEDQSKKQRIKRALEFFHSGKSAKDIAMDAKFFFYWTAITVLCGEGTLQINFRLQKIYGFTKEEVEKNLYWGAVCLARNNFFKRGKSIRLHKQEERYLQLLFLDLLRHDLGLSTVKAALSGVSNLDLKAFC